MHIKLRKLSAALLAVLLVLTMLSGCSDTEETSSVTSSEAESSAVESSAVESSETESSAVESESSGVTTEEIDYDFGDGLTEDGYFEGVTALDYVTLPDYRNIEIPADVSTIPDEDVEAEMNDIFDDFNGPVQIMDRAVEDGDTINIDYVGSIDGVEFEGGSTDGLGSTVTVGVTNFIDDFLQQLIGHMPGETVNVEVTFPEYYGQEHLNGKDALFVTTINYIAGDEDMYSELNDEFVAAELNEAYGWTTVEQMRTELKQSMLEDAVGEYRLEQVQETAVISEVPQSIYDYQLINMINYYKNAASQYNITYEDYLEQIGIASEEELIETNSESLQTNAEASLLFQALSEDMGIVATDEDVASYFSEELGMTDYTQYSDYYGMPYLRMLVREDMVQEAMGKL